MRPALSFTKPSFSRVRAAFSLGCIPLLGCALLAPSYAQENNVSATLSVAQPPQQAIVSHIGEEPGGWQWRWTDDTGRRDVGQTFTSPSAFDLDKIVLAVRSGSSSAVSRTPFTLTLSRYANAQSTLPEEKLASWKGMLPNNETGGAYQQGMWLTFDVPNFKLQAEKTYGFTLQFDSAKPTGQGVVFSVSQTQTYSGGQGVFSTDGNTWQKNSDFNFLIVATNAGVPPTTPIRAARTLEVDPTGATEFKTIASAAKVAIPGDTISLKPNSGPYREILYVPTSGTAQAPITIEGNGNLITGFDTLSGWSTQNGVTSCRLPAFPCVLTYKGERLVQDYSTKQFTKYATINDSKDTLTLLSGTSTEGWEISKRPFVVQITNTSYQTFRNIRASGSTNDGFNLHGEGQGLIFENIEGFHNLDEGYSAHDTVVSEIRGGKFWGNDNGIANVGQSNTKLAQVDVWGNLGYGFWLNDCIARAENIRSWENGADQIIFRGATVSLNNVHAFTPALAARPWVSYMESTTATVSKSYSENRSQLTGVVSIRPEVRPTGG